MSSEKTIKMYKKFPFLPSLFKHYFTYSSDKKKTHTHTQSPNKSHWENNKKMLQDSYNL